jgi:hypothetical protein
MYRNIEDLHLDEHMLEVGIKFVGLITKNGRLVASNDKNSLKLSKEQKEMFFMSCSLQQRMSQDYDNDFGQVKYAVTERENIRIISIPYESDTLIFVVDKRSEFLAGVKIIMDAIKHVKAFLSVSRNIYNLQ